MDWQNLLGLRWYHDPRNWPMIYRELQAAQDERSRALRGDLPQSDGEQAASTLTAAAIPAGLGIMRNRLSPEGDIAVMNGHPY